MDCYFDSSGCYVCPQLPATPGTAAKIVSTPNLGWNAGANSITQIGGNVSMTDALTEVPTGIVIGIKIDRMFNTEPTRILHGLYFYTVNNQSFVQVVEKGISIGDPKPYTIGTKFEIRRVGSRVTYWLGGALLALSKAASLAPVLVNACFYSAGDIVP